MQNAHPMVELWRGERVESQHLGHAVVVHAETGIVDAWGDPEMVIYPRSSCKMIQALPLVESGVAARAGLGARHLALACASHEGAHLHTDAVRRWLADLGLSESDLRCGVQFPRDRTAAQELTCADGAADQTHNNCSGKHAGFLTLNRTLGGDAEYVAPEHPVQQAVKAAFEEVTESPAQGYGIDGCAAPNFATPLAGLARAMAFFAAAREGGGARQDAAARLVQAMMAHPELVAGEGRACTELMRAMAGRVAVKTGAEGVFIAIVPERKLGIAVKITDGATRAAEAAIVALLVRAGVLDAAHPAAQGRLDAVQRNWRGMETGVLRAAPGFP